MTIDIGSEASDRGNQWTLASYTVVNKNNPANASGIITQVEIYPVVGKDLVNCIVGTFYTTNGNTLKCRAAVAIGAVVGGAKRTFAGLSLAVEAGDFIGYYQDGADGWLERATSGGVGIWYVSGQEIDPNDEAEYTLQADNILSLYGTGEEAVPAAGVGGPANLVAAGVI